MKMSTQSILRITSGGVIFFGIWRLSVFLFGSAFAPLGELAGKAVQDSIGSVLFSFPVGFLVDVYRRRQNHVIWPQSKDAIHTLVSAAALEAHREVDGRQARGIFYQVVDEDKSLAKKSSQILVFGLAVTTTVDVIIVASFYMMIAPLVVPLQAVALAELLYLSTAGLGALGYHLAHGKHGELCKEQRDVVEQLHWPTLKKAIVSSRVA